MSYLKMHFSGTLMENVNKVKLNYVNRLFE